MVVGSFETFSARANVKAVESWKRCASLFAFDDDYFDLRRSAASLFFPVVDPIIPIDDVHGALIEENDDRTVLAARS